MRFENFPKIELKENMKIIVGLDLSGSIAYNNDFLKMYRYYLSQITEQLYTTNAKVCAVSFDTRVGIKKDYNSNNLIDLIDFHYHAKNTCGGGSSLNLIYKYDKEQEFNADKFIIFTDGYIDLNLSDEEKSKTIFVLINVEDKDTIFEIFEKRNLTFVKSYLE